MYVHFRSGGDFFSALNLSGDATERDVKVG